MNRPTIGFESHRPERRRRAGTTLYGPGCCCCCCCLHTVGSLLGAVVAPAFGSPGSSPITIPPGVADHVTSPPPETGIKAVESAIQSERPEPIRLEADEDRPSILYAGGSGVTAVSLFWMILFALSVICSVWLAVAGGSDSCGGALLVLAMTMPAFQLGSIVLVAIVLCFWTRPDRGHQFSQLGRVTLGTFVGTVAGILLMILIGVLMSLK